MTEQPSAEAVIAEAYRRLNEELAAAAPAPTAPAPPPPPSPADPTVAARRAEALVAAQAAAAERAERERLLEGAKVLLAPQFQQHGVSPGEMDEMPEDDLLALAGLTDARTPAEAQGREHARIAADAAASAAYEREAEQRQLAERWWQLAEHERRQQAEALGVSYDDLHAERVAEAARGRFF